MDFHQEASIAGSCSSVECGMQLDAIVSKSGLRCSRRFGHGFQKLALQIDLAVGTLHIFWNPPEF